jgi:serpin B
LALLPSEVDGLSGLESSLSCEMLDESIAELQGTLVSLSLPRFEVTSEFRLAEMLFSMGMPDAFTGGTADFSGMDDQTGLYISDVLHKGFVEVNEGGTEAAAATAVVMAYVTTSLYHPTPEVFCADHPFLFLIRDNTTQSILFMGRVTSPSSSSVAVPEPSTLASLLSMAAVGLLAFGRWRHGCYSPRPETGETPTAGRGRHAARSSS